MSKSNLKVVHPEKLSNVIDQLEISVEAFSCAISLMMINGSLGCCPDEELIALLSVLRDDLSSWVKKAGQLAGLPG